jgi:hypothetical protein
MAARFHRPEFNANDIARQRYEHIKQLQGLHVDVALLSERNLKFCVYCTYINTRVTDKAVNSRRPQETGLLTTDCAHKAQQQL